MANLLVVDDEESFRTVLKLIFEAEGYNVFTANNGQKGLDFIKSEPCDLIVSDVRMPDMDGISLLRAAREFSPEIGIVLMTAFGTIDTAREAFKLGADDFIQKPFNNEELRLIVKRTLEKQVIIKENKAFKLAQRTSGSITNIIGNSPKMQALHSMIEKVAKEDATILITGESGTGKELFARAIHDVSQRNEKPFIPINCGAMPENLLEAELFGFLKGSFTGAMQNRTGLFESADKGSIFLDEIGDMPPVMQVKILRVLQDRKIRPVGGTSEVEVDTRVIAATNRNLKQLIDEGIFRQDLYYRLSVIPLHIPPLRERREDIPDLVNHFVRKFSSRSGKTIGIPAETMSFLQNRTWEGNVRELEHTIERAVALTSDGDDISADYCREDSPYSISPHVSLPPEGMHLPTYLNELEKTLLEEALMRVGGNQTRAAEVLKIPVHAVRHLLVKHHIHQKHPI